MKIATIKTGLASLAMLPGLVMAAPAVADKADNAFMMICTALVLFMTIPGIALFYGGLIRGKNVLSMLTQVTVTFALVCILWVVYGYSLAFGEGNNFFGNINWLMLKNIELTAVMGSIYQYIHVAFQGSFACITVGLIVGALAERIRFSAVLIFVVVWLTLSYIPIAHMVWGGGLLAWAQEMNLPCKTLLKGLDEAIARRGTKTEDFSEEDTRDINDSLILDTPESPLADAVANVLTMTLLKKAQLKSTVMPQVQQYAWDKAANSNQPLAHTVVLLNSGGDATQTAAILSGLTAEQSTIERALAMNWLAKYMATMPPVVLPAPAGAWAKHKLTGGGEDWRWVGQGVPDILSFGDELSPQNVQVRWREPAKMAQQSNIPVTVERQLYRLIPGEEEMSFILQPVTSNEIDSDALYLDEITLTSEQDAVLRYGQVEVPLPPGADVERTTWGISVNKPNAAKQQGQLLEKARNEMGELAYMVPVKELTGTVTFRHLLRFSQKGQFVLPPARYVRSYAPAQQSVAAGSEWTGMQVK